MSDVSLQIVDIAFYLGKPAELLQDIKKFSPTTLLLDWCFTKNGFTKKQLTSSGLVSRIILGNELSLITARGEITLSDEQTAILEDIEKLDLTSDNSGQTQAGTIVFLQGQLGSGKTVLGLEIGRMIVNKRKLLLPGKEVTLTFAAPKEYAVQLLKTLREKQYKIEEQGDRMVRTLEQLLRNFSREL